MKKLILAAVLVSATFTASAARPIDGDRNHVKGVKAANAFADYVEALGYRCSSITSFMPALFRSTKFNLKCNSYRYSYSIEDKGGRWVVTLD